MKTLLTIIFVMATTLTAAQDRESRTWTSDDGKFSVEATLVSANPETVVLRLTGDREGLISVPRDRLSEKDLDYVRGLARRLPKRKPEPSEKEKEPEEPKTARSLMKEAEEDEVWQSFRGIYWGDLASDFDDLVEVDDDGEGTTMYERKGDRMTIGGAEIESIHYVFYNGLFSGIHVITHGRSNWTRLRDTVFVRYGEGRKPNRFSEKWVWRRPVILMSLEYNRVAERGSLLKMSRPAMQAMEQEQERRAEEAAERDF